MDYKRLEALGDRAKEISSAFYADCDAYSTKAAVEKYRKKDGMTLVMLSPDLLNIPNADALLFVWNAYRQAADVAFIQSSPQGRQYIQ